MKRCMGSPVHSTNAPRQDSGGQNLIGLLVVAGKVVPPLGRRHGMHKFNDEMRTENLKQIGSWTILPYMYNLDACYYTHSSHMYVVL